MGVPVACQGPDGSCSEAQGVTSGLRGISMTFPGINITELINSIKATMGTSTPAGLSDQLAAEYIRATGQQGSQAAQSGVQLALQQQQNQLRFNELMGADAGGHMTDAARRWRDELTAQQGVQNQRLAQELGGLTGYYGGQTTLAERQRTDANAQSEAERALRLRLQTEQQGWQSGESAAERASRLALQQGQQAWQGQESLYERQLRERLQAGQLSQQESEFARNYLNQRAALGGYMLDANGNSTGQLTEAGRAARSAEAARMAELSGQLEGGGLTEESRAAREGERNQRAGLAAQLLSAPKDVFKAGAFFRSLGGDAGNMMGLGGGGVSGFNTMAGRMATPGTVSLEDVEQQAGGAMGQQGQNMYMGGSTTPGAAQTGSAAAAPVTQDQQATATGQEDPQAAAMAKLLGTGSTTDQTQTDPAMAGGNPPTPDEQVNDGSQPAGPVGDPSALVAAGLGDLGLGGGGNFTGRAQPATVTDPIPYVDPRVLEEPELQAMFRDMRQQGVRNSAANRVASRGARPSGPGGPTGRTGKPAGPGPHRFGQKTAEGRRNSSERMLLGLNRILQKASLPGTQPGGPVDAALWPADGGGSAMPQVQDPGSLGQSSSFQAPAPSASPIASVDQGNQQAALDEMKYRLAQGPGSMGPQTLERMSGTQRGVMEGALEALGLRPEDFNEAYAQTRFANVGNVLSA